MLRSLFSANVTPSLLSPSCTFFFLSSHFIPPLKCFIRLCRYVCLCDPLSAATAQSGEGQMRRTRYIVWREQGPTITKPCASLSHGLVFTIHSKSRHNNISLSTFLEVNWTRGCHLTVFWHFCFALAGGTLEADWQFLQEHMQGQANRRVCDDTLVSLSVG